MVDADAPAPASNGGPSNLKLTRSTKSLRALSPKGSSLPSVLKSLQERKQNTPQRRKIMRCWWVIVAVTRLRRTARVKLTAAEMEFVKGVYDKSGGLRSMLQVRDVLAQCGQNLTDNELEALLQQVWVLWCFNVLCCATLMCYAVLYTATLCLLCHDVSCCAVLCCAVLCFVALCYAIKWGPGRLAWQKGPLHPSPLNFYRYCFICQKAEGKGVETCWDQSMQESTTVNHRQKCYNGPKKWTRMQIVA